MIYDSDETPEERKMTLSQLVGDAHQRILAEPVPKTDNLKAAMRLLEMAQGRLRGRH